MSCYCVQQIKNEVARLKEAMFRAVDKHGYNHPTVHLISSKIDPLVSALCEVQLHKARRNQAMKSERRANGSSAQTPSHRKGPLKISPDPSRN